MAQSYRVLECLIYDNIILKNFGLLKQILQCSLCIEYRVRVVESKSKIAPQILLMKQVHTYFCLAFSNKPVWIESRTFPENLLFL